MRRRDFWSVACVAALALAGCAPPPPGDRERVTPSPELARRALQASLDAWVAGRPGGPTAMTNPSVESSDSWRADGRRLASYEILGLVAAIEPRGFAVRLHLRDPDETQDARYVVIGQDPVWVFRFEDYERLGHWEHKMDADPAPPSAPPHHDREPAATPP